MPGSIIFFTYHLRPEREKKHLNNATPLNYADGGNQTRATSKQWTALSITPLPPSAKYYLDEFSSGGGKSGRAMALESWEGLQLFQFRIGVNILSLGVRLILITLNSTVRSFPSSFLFPIVVYHCQIDELCQVRRYLIIVRVRLG